MELSDLILIHTVKKITCQPEANRSAQYDGCINISSHYICFEGRDLKIWILHRNIQRLENKVLHNKIVLHCKDFQIVTLFLTDNTVSIQSRLVQTLQNLIGVKDVRTLYPFYYKPSNNSDIEGWSLFDDEKELSWIGFPTSKWAISSANRDYSLCPSYSKTVIVSSDVKDVQSLSVVREGGRFPVPVYMLSTNTVQRNTTQTQSVLMRCGRLVSTADDTADVVTMFTGLCRTSGKGKGYILNTCKHSERDTTDMFRYPGWTIQHVELPNPNHLTATIEKMTRSDTWHTGNKDWLDVVWSLLNHTRNIVLIMTREKHSVCIQGNRAYELLLSSLTQLCLDSHYRTTVGFQSLIVREWLGGGYKFQHSSSTNYNSLFLLFLHSVLNLTTTHPTCFQISEEFLLEVYHNSVSSVYGTFLCDTNHEREQNEVKNKTLSIWGYLNHMRNYEKFNNPSYKPFKGYLIPNLEVHRITPWARMFCRSRKGDFQLDILHMKRWNIYTRLEDLRLIRDGLLR